MIMQSDLTLPFCRSLVISCTPSPSKFNPGSDYTVVTLGDLDLIGPRFVGFYISGIKSGVNPFHLDNVFILNARTTTINDAAFSIYNNAKWVL
jgi:hypothetical protein